MRNDWLGILGVFIWALSVTIAFFARNWLLEHIRKSVEYDLMLSWKTSELIFEQLKSN